MINVEPVMENNSSSGFILPVTMLRSCKCYYEKYKNNLIRGLLKFVFSRLIKTDPCLLN